MNAADAIAFAALVIGVISVAGIALEAWKRRVDFREKELELLSRHTAEKAAQYAAHAERLEQRVRVLERIAIEKTDGLASEIEALRDPHVN